MTTGIHEAPIYRDAGGFAAFSRGRIGTAHVAAHRMLDEGRYEEGYRHLRAFIGREHGSGSDWIHLQWHLAVFELSTGRRGDARRRFEHHILPAVASCQALTDGPSL
ncbi:MAG: hypothetical protein R3190_07900, partial [Thermoanaerobaculia bacterium]|nr:hypothetical protein [Thermoanaerobaculia bacterium]